MVAQCRDCAFAVICLRLTHKLVSTMAKMTIAQEVEAALASGSVVELTNKFVDSTGNPVKVRSMESSSDPLEVGDIIAIPVDYKVLRMAFSDDDDAPTYPYIFVEVTSADASVRNFRFFPNSLVKTVIPYVDGKRQSRVKTTGTATDLFYTSETVDAGLALLRGRRIRVTESTAYDTRDYVSKETKTTHIYRYDLV